MTKRVISIHPKDTVKKALEIFSKRGISGAPVVKNRKVVGILSQTDIVKLIDYRMPKIYLRSSKLFPMVLSLAKADDDFSAMKKSIHKLTNLKVGDVMTKKVLTVKQGEDVLIAANIMDINQINRLPVLNDKERICGIITRADIIRALTSGR